jgi:hypothetical protein
LEFRVWNGHWASGCCAGILAGCVVGHSGEGELFGFGTAADPEEAIEVNAGSSGGLGMERVGHVDPGADAVVLRQTRDEGKGQRCAAGAFGTGELGEGTDGKTAGEGLVESGDAGGGCGADDAWSGGERGRDAVGKGGFDLLAEVGSGDWHATALSPYIRLYEARGQGEICTGIATEASAMEWSEEKLSAKIIH